MTVQHLGKSIGWSSLRVAFLLIPLVLAGFALSSTAKAACQDACLTNNNTVQGDDALISLTTGFNNTANGSAALKSNTTGGDNTATGVNALINNTEGVANTATGVNALRSNTTGFQNTANGGSALQSNTTGDNNTANGSGALLFNTTGSNNTANGSGALLFNTTGSSNTANGYQALLSNTEGTGSTANGYQALYSNTTGIGNTATGDSALFSNTTGIGNTANGFDALRSNTTGTSNTANGVNALWHNATGNLNTATGNAALFRNTTGNNNTATGLQALTQNTTGGDNIALGFRAGLKLTTGSNNIDIGNEGVAGESNTIRIGTQGTQTATYLAGITGKTSPKGMPIFINANGQLGTVTSSERFKDAIKPMDKASEVILALKPVTFHYKKELDPESIPQFGLVAEQVEKVNPDLVVRDGDGKPYTVRYEAVNAMLLNEFLKEHRKVESQACKIREQETTITQLKQGMETVVARLKEQDSKIQKVTDQLELSKRAPQMVGNSR